MPASIPVKLYFSAQSFDGTAPDAILYIPAGVNSVCCGKTKGGETVPFTVQVEGSEELAAKLNDDLQTAHGLALAGKASRPFVDFNHEHGRAAAIPTEFFWEEGKGVMMRLEWTPAGRQAVEGKEFSYYSPEVAFDSSTNQILGLKQPGAVGGLVNIPAFQNQTAIAASLSTPTTNPNMDALLQLLKDLGLVAADATEISPDAVAALKEKLTAKPAEAEEVTALKASLKQAESDRDTAKASLATLHAAAAEKFVTEQIKCGRITEDSKELWTSRAKADLTETERLVMSFKAPSGAPHHVTLTAAHAHGEQKRTMKRDDFNKLSHAERNQYMAGGNKLTD